MANYDIVEFIAIMQRLIDKFLFLANKDIKRKSGLRLFLISKLKGFEC